MLYSPQLSDCLVHFFLIRIAQWLIVMVQALTKATYSWCIAFGAKIITGHFLTMVAVSSLVRSSPPAITSACL